MASEGNLAEARRFLEWVRPGGPWVLTAIPPDGGQTDTRTFEAEGEALEAWLAGHNGRQNLYWMVNPARTRLTSKAKKEDVQEMAFLHVDLDPAKGRDPAAERPALLARLQAFVPPPSAIVYSGNGYQGLWRLDSPLHLGGDATRTADAEAYNQQLEVVLGGDHCHNIDRILRLPGTANLPNAKKRKAGRVKSQAAITELTAHAYPLASFTSAPTLQGARGSDGPGRVKISGNLAPVLVDDLPEAVTLRTRMLIVQGDDPDDPTKYGSRSAVVWAVCCEMIRAGCDDDTIASVLLDPDYGVSAHVRDQSRPEQYATRQIQRAREEVVEPMLRNLNERHAVILDLGGKCRVISEVMDESLSRPRLRISKQSFEDFRNRYMNVRVEVGRTDKGQSIYSAAGKWWLSHPLRRQYTSMIFAPRRELEDAYNLWQGFACEAIPGAGHEGFLAHVRDNICNGDEDHYGYLVRWMARAVQFPGEAGQVAVVLRGGQGTGKGTLATVFGSLWGRHFLHVTSAKHLVGQFNSHLRDCVVLFADEAFFAGDKQHESVLKAVVTEETLVIEGKGVDAEVGPNYTHLIMGSNSQWVVPAGADDRRFYVLEVGEAQKQDTTYFRAIHKAIDSGGRENLLHFLMSLDISDFEVRTVPKTAGLQEQKLYSLTLEESWWLERLMDGRTTASTAEWTLSITKERVQSDYLRYAESQRAFRRVSPTALGKFLARVMPPGFPISVQRTADVVRVSSDGHEISTRERIYFYDMPGLQDCRDSWDARFGGPYPWPQEEDSVEAAYPSGPDPY